MKYIDITYWISFWKFKLSINTKRSLTSPNGLAFCIFEFEDDSRRPKCHGDQTHKSKFISTASSKPPTWHVTNGANFKYWQAKVTNNLSSINIYADGTPHFWLYSNHLAYNPNNHWYQLKHSLAGPAPPNFSSYVQQTFFLSLHICKN